MVPLVPDGSFPMPSRLNFLKYGAAWFRYMYSIKQFVWWCLSGHRCCASHYYHNVDDRLAQDIWQVVQGETL